MDSDETRHFEMVGRDDAHLRHRLATFRDAVHARGGSIIDVRLAPQTAKRERAASIAYTLPFAGLASTKPPTDHRVAL